MKNYTVNFEVILAGGVDVEANNKKEAEKIAKEQVKTISDLRNFWIVSKYIEDVEEFKLD